MKNIRPTKGDKKEVREEMRLTRPPRMEGKVKEAMMQPKRKHKLKRLARPSSRKMQGPTEKQRKDYQLKSKRH